MSGKKVFAIIFSLLLHLSLILLAIHSSKHKLHNKVSTSVSVQLLELEIIKTSSSVSGLGDGNTIPNIERICSPNSKSYIGAGFLYSSSTYLVIYIPETYPAYLAGLRLGDMIMNPFVDPVNGYFEFDILRHYQHMHFSVKADKICFKED